MNAAEVVRRARSALGNSTTYKLGMGGFSPTSPVPWNLRGECDCSGFVAWCLGVSRHVPDPRFTEKFGAWLETTQVFKDAESPFGWFDAIPIEISEPGDIIVYGDRRKLGILHQGHIGLITKPEGQAVIHCSSGNFRKRGDAIGEDSPNLWLNAGGVAARCAFIRG